MLWPVVKALLGHYRRYPLQIILVWLGLTLGVALLVGVTAINHHANQSYTNGEKLFANPYPYRIRSKFSANKIPQGLYIDLRRAGFQECAPFDMLRLTTADDLDFTLVGVDPIAMLPAGNGTPRDTFMSLGLMQAPYPVLVSSDLAGHMQWRDGQYIALNNGHKLGPIMVDKADRTVGTRMIADMSVVRHLHRSGGLTVIGCRDMSESRRMALKSMLPPGVTMVRSNSRELESLTKAFHLNLSAMGMLSFIVGLFIFYQAMSLSFSQRQRLVGILRQIGVTSGQLTRALLIELTLLVLVAWVCGNVFGLILANQLIVAVSTSLGELYDANVGFSIDWSWAASLYSLVMAVLGAFFSCLWPMVRLLRTSPIRLSARLSLMRFTGREFFWQALLACAFIVLAVAVYQLPETMESGLTIIALVLLSVALATPFIIWFVFDRFSYRLRWVKMRWFFADAAASMSYRGVATMAFMLALAANIGVETMVGSFRDTTDKWLTQRLAADLYIQPTNSAAAGISHWLQQQPEVKDVWWRWIKDIHTTKGALQVISSGASEGEHKALTVKLGVTNYWYMLQHTKSAMISESMAIKLGIRPGDHLSFAPPLGTDWLVVGIYYDYGNPYNQVLISQNNWNKYFAGSGDVSLGVVLKNGKNNDKMKSRITRQFNIGGDRIFDSYAIHNQAMRVFDHTFAVAATLGNITLVIAVFGLFFATLSGEYSRQRHIALMRCLGVSGKELVFVGGMQLFVFGIIASLVAIPLGLTLANLIVDIVLKQSFGWSLELQILPWKYAQTIFWAMLAIMLAGALPVLRLINRTPMKSLRDSM